MRPEYKGRPRRAKSTVDECYPRGGLAEHVYCSLYVMDGKWSSFFLNGLKSLGVETVPQRFYDVAMRIKLRRESDRRMQDAADEATREVEARCSTMPNVSS